jgi:hypothetical protein
MSNKHYEVNLENGKKEFVSTLAEARSYVKSNMYSAKVVSIVSSKFDKNSNEKRNYIKF